MSKTFRGIGDPNTDGIRVASQDDLDAAVARAEQAVDDAEAQAGAAEASAQAADASAAAAAASAVEAAGYATDAEATLNDFETKYLGEKVADPTLDNQGGALLTGALYYNSVAENLKVYTGTVWKGSLLAVTGPVIDENLVVWDGTTGTVVKDGGELDLSEFVKGPASSVVDNAAAFADTTGKLLKDAGVPPGGGGLSYADTVLLDSPDSFWLMQETSGPSLVDSSGNSNNGTWSGVAQGGVSCLPNESGAVSADWPTGGAGLVVPNLMSNSVPTTAYTLELWFRTTDTGGRMDLWNKNNVGAANRVTLRLNQSQGVDPDLGKVTLTQNGSSTSTQWVSNSSPVNFYDGQPHHLALIYNQPNVNIVLDGVDLGVTGTVGATGQGILDDDANARIGLHVAAGSLGDFIGNISHYSVWYSTSISVAQVQAHYLAGTT